MCQWINVKVISENCSYRRDVRRTFSFVFSTGILLILIIRYSITDNWPVTVAERSNACTVFAPTQGMDV
jgi:hypothetical protein